MVECFGVMFYDIEGVFWSYWDDFCIFDVFLVEFGLLILVLDWLVLIVWGVDMVCFDFVFECVGLLVVLLGLLCMYFDDFE